MQEFNLNQEQNNIEIHVNFVHNLQFQLSRMWMGIQLLCTRTTFDKSLDLFLGIKYILYMHFWETIISIKMMLIADPSHTCLLDSVHCISF